MEKVKASTDGFWSATTTAPPLVSPPPPASSWTNPLADLAPPTSTEPAPIDPAAMLDQLVANIDGVRSAVLASVDGFGLARSRSMTDEASHPAMLAAAVGLAHQLVAMGGGTQLRQLVVDHDGGLLLVWPIGDQRVLAVLASPTVEQRSVRSFVRSQLAVFSGADS